MRISEAFENDCRRVRSALRSGQAGQAEEIHLFRCEACRLEARIAAAWRALPDSRSLETGAPVDEAFVRRVLWEIRRERRHRIRARASVAAAAALLFFFALGASRESAASRAAGAEDSYAQLLTPELDSFLPE
ncbi:MAG: hypothetical protein M3167_09610 [Acidobacteriota bacterium]|nr:hypothetical protein [Acidobacteriota bacterium]